MFDIERSFENWFARIIINCNSDFYRSKKNETSDIENYMFDLKSNDPDILDQISYDELLECISKLSPHYRSVFNLYIIDGYKHNEIAEILNISEGTSKSNLNRAKKQLQLILKENFNILGQDHEENIDFNNPVNN